MSETKSEIRARIDELLKFRESLQRSGDSTTTIHRVTVLRQGELEADLREAQEDLYKSVVRSHEVLCAVKNMDAKAAYGQDPAMYYALAVCGEAGEMANKIVKALRNGDDPDAARAAIVSELPDVFIYGAVLAYVLDIDLTKIVNEKVDVVIERAKSGYYGGPLQASEPEGER